MREKKRKLVITFHTTTDAMAMEKLCRGKGLPGRLIPVPQQISAGCGMAWRAEPGEEPSLRQAIEAAGLTVEGYYEVLM